MDNISKVNNNAMAELCITREISLKGNKGFNESNLMVLPWFSLKRKKISKMETVWVRDNEEVKLTVKGSEDLGVPTIYEVDVLLALLKIKCMSMNDVLLINENNNIVGMDNTINFTYRNLAKVMGIKTFGKSTKVRLEKSIRCLIETTIYSEFSIKDNNSGKYIYEFNGEESARVLCKYKAYSVTKRKRADEKLLSPKEIKEMQSIQIDDFFFKNIICGYLRIFDLKKYYSCKKAMSKKLIMMLSQWSHGHSKFIKYETMMSYMGELSGDNYKIKYELREAAKELTRVNFIHSYKSRIDGIEFIFNKTLNDKKLYKDRYNKHEDIVARLREIGIDYNDIVAYCSDEIEEQYVSALLRYVDQKIDKDEIEDIYRYVLKGLPYGTYNVDKFKN